MEQQTNSQEPSIEEFMATVDSLQFSIEPILMEAYSGRRGRRPYDPLSMFKAVLYRTRTRSLRQLCKELQSNSRLLKLVGLPNVPTHQTFSVFLKRTGEKRLQKISQLIVLELKKHWPDFGNVLSVDGTVVKAYARRNRGIRSSTDPDARLGYKEHHTDKPVFEFGYRFIIASEAQREIPVTAITKPANANESRLYPAILKQLKNMGIQFEIVVADAQYDSRKNTFLTIAYGAKPIIALNPRASKTAKQTGTRRGDSILPIPRNSSQWKQYLTMRSSSERVNSSLKDPVGLETLKARRLPCVATFFWICAIAKQLFALSAARLGRDELCRSVLVWCY